MASLPGTFPAQASQFPGPHRVPSELPLGKWNLMANGRIFHLTIHGVDGSEVQADIDSGSIGYAKWDRSSGKLIFTRVTTITQKYTGYLLHYSDKETHWRLAGVFGDVTVGEQAGWYATKPR